LVIQRKRSILLRVRASLRAYVPKEKRVFGYFALPVLVGEELCGPRLKGGPGSALAADAEMDLGGKRRGSRHKA